MTDSPQGPSGPATRGNEKAFTIRGAAPLDPNDHPVETVIRIGPATVSDHPHGDAFRHDAGRLADALIDSLPGGTLDALLIELLEQRRSELIVPTRRNQ